MCQDVPTAAQHLVDSVQANAEAIAKLTSTIALALSESNAYLAPMQPQVVATEVKDIEKLYGLVIKHENLADYKPYGSVNVHEWLQQFNAAIAAAESKNIQYINTSNSNHDLLAASSTAVTKVVMNDHRSSDTASWCKSVDSSTRC